MLHWFKPDLTKTLTAAKAEAELKIYEYTNNVRYSEAMLGYYNIRLKEIETQLAERQKGPPVMPV